MLPRSPLPKAKPRRRKRTRTCRLQIEPLETRVVPSLDLLSQWNGSTPFYSDGWVVGDIAFLGHYGNNNGVHVLDVSDPYNPTLTATIPIGDIRDIEAQWQYYDDEWHLIGYFSSDIGFGLYVYDVSNPYAPVQLFRITNQHGGQPQNTVHTLSVEGDWLYEADSRTATVRVFNVSDPRNPQHVRNIVSPIGDAVHEVTVQWGRLYTAGIWGQSSAEIWDVTPLDYGAAPVYLGRIAGGALGPMAHTTWPTDDGNFMAVAREAANGDLSFWDISNPASPQLVWRMDLREPGGCCVHQVMIRGNYLFTSWYTAGIYVHDISDPYNPVQLGHFDSFGGGSGGYNGAWGVFGNWWWDNRVYAFDMTNGLFVLWLDPFAGPGGSPSGGGSFDGSTSQAVRGRAGAGRDVLSFRPDQVARLDGDVLTLTLGAGDDTLEVNRSADGRSINVVVNGTMRFSYAADQVRRLNVRALEGNDRIVLDPDLNVHLNLDGGPGDDVVEGWSEAYVNPPIVHQGVVHAPKITRYTTQSVERLVNSVNDRGLPGVIDYSAHQLIEHAETTEGLTGAEGLTTAGHSNYGALGSLGSSLAAAHGRAAAAGTEHLFGVKQVVWHKPWCY